MTTDQDKRRTSADITPRTRTRTSGRIAPAAAAAAKPSAVPATSAGAPAKSPLRAQPRQAPAQVPAQAPQKAPAQAPAKAPAPAPQKAPGHAPAPEPKPLRRPEPKQAPKALGGSVPKAVRKPVAALVPGGRRPPRAPFVLLVVGLLGGGLVSLLLLNTVLAQDSFKYNELRRITEQLHQQADEQKNDIREKLQPGNLAERADGFGLELDNSSPEFVGEGAHPASLGERLADPAAGPTAQPRAPRATGTPAPGVGTAGEGTVR
ncbi:hypothetical protein Acor_10700 [Acrocarpospora corrugata]|uniref:Cell division protein FtsL n=1 Tax=Acrocarpospora corrugata TaxID=35763 RepID=A0A5M3VQE3_9ACTN|nr:hypothetical protein [Acrocarpospora corrugata]GER99006.1 hypothetical protein Acor_10700 [Acrocarpospora corrugata]